MIQESVQDHQQNIDDIFEQADQAMSQQKQKTQYHKREFKKLKKFCLKTGIIFLIIIALIGVALWVGIIEFKDGYSMVRDELLTEYQRTQGMLLTKDNNELTVEEYFLKETMLLLSYNELEERFVESDDLANAKHVFQLQETGKNSLMTKDEQARYDELQKQYDEYVKNGGDPKQKYVDAVANGQIKN